MLPHPYGSVPRAADDVVLIRVPTDVPHTRVMARQSGDHVACQYVINDDFASGAARIDEPLPSAELRRETGADEGVQNTMTTISHHRGVAGQLVSLQGSLGDLLPTVIPILLGDSQT